MPRGWRAKFRPMPADQSKWGHFAHVADDPIPKVGGVLRELVKAMLDHTDKLDPERGKSLRLHVQAIAAAENNPATIVKHLRGDTVKEVKAGNLAVLDKLLIDELAPYFKAIRSGKKIRGGHFPGVMRTTTRSDA